MNEQGLADADVNVNVNVDASDSRSLSDRCGFERWIRIGHEATVTAFEVVFMGSEAPLPEVRTRQALSVIGTPASPRNALCPRAGRTKHNTQRTKHKGLN